MMLLGNLVFVNRLLLFYEFVVVCVCIRYFILFLIVLQYLLEWCIDISVMSVYVVWDVVLGLILCCCRLMYEVQDLFQLLFGFWCESSQEYVCWMYLVCMFLFMVCSVGSMVFILNMQLMFQWLNQLLLFFCFVCRYVMVLVISVFFSVCFIWFSVFMICVVMFVDGVFSILLKLQNGCVVISLLVLFLLNVFYVLL